MAAPQLTSDIPSQGYGFLSSDPSAFSYLALHPLLSLLSSSASFQSHSHLLTVRLHVNFSLYVSASVSKSPLFIQVKSVSSWLRAHPNDLFLT